MLPCSCLLGEHILIVNIVFNWLKHILLHLCLYLSLKDECFYRTNKVFYVYYFHVILGHALPDQNSNSVPIKNGLFSFQFWCHTNLHERKRFVVLGELIFFPLMMFTCQYSMGFYVTGGYSFIIADVFLELY